MLVIAHRGANREDLENSWSAFERAIDAKSQRIELDVQLTKDGELVVMHDHDLRRTCGISGNVAEMTRRELAQSKLLNGEPLPFLDEVISKLLPRVELNIEIKDEQSAAGAAVAKLLRNNAHLHSVIVSSFHAAPLEYLAHHHPEVTLACLWGDVFSWPQFSHYSPLVFMLRTGARIVHPWTDFVTENFMDQARNRGWKVFPYAAFNGEEEDREGLWAYMKTMGVDGLCTNYPREFHAWQKKVRDDAARFGN